MTSSQMPLLRIDQVAKSFGKTRAVDGVSLDIKENEFFALLGPSGCGKTTLLRMLAGFETLDGGKILISGKDISPLPPEKRPLNLMFQSYALFPHMSVRQNLNYGLEMERLPRKTIRRRVDETLASTDLTTLADRKPDQLSGGQKQRVALARALVKRPRVLLLDEPLGALDKKLRERMQLELKRLQHEAGITFIIVTHDQEEALVMADRMAILKDGKLLQAGTPEQIYEEPADRFVANFIGIMNFLDGEIDGTHTFVVDGSRHRVSVKHGPRKAVLAVRPEHVSITESADGLGVIITDVAYHGLDRVLHARTSSSGQALQLRLSAAEGQKYATGQAIKLAFNADKCRIY